MAATLALAIGLYGCDDAGTTGSGPGGDGDHDGGHVGVDPTEDDSGVSTDEPDAGNTMDASSGDGDGDGFDGGPMGDGDGDGDMDGGGDGDLVDSGTPEPSTRLEAEDADEQFGVGTEACTEGGLNVKDVGNGEYIGFYNFTFDGVTGFKIRTAGERHPATFEIRKNNPTTGTLVATCEPPVSGDWQSWTTVTCDAAPNVTGTGKLYISFHGADDNGGFLPNINWIDIVKNSDQVEPTHIEAENYIGNLHLMTEDCGDEGGGKNIMDVGNNEWAAYDDFNFNGINSFNVRVASNNFPSKVKFRKGSPTGAVIATCDAPFTGGWQTWVTVSCTGTAQTGVGALYVVFEGGNEGDQLPNVNWFESVALPVDEDAGTDLVDSGTDLVDSGTDVVDSGVPVDDAGSEEPDAGSPSGPAPFVGYHFDETSGTTAADFSGGGHDMTTSGATSWVAGKSGKALHLDGGDGFAALPADIMAGVHDFTIATWINLDQIDTWSRIFDFGNDTENYMLLTPRGFDNNGPMVFEIKVNNNSEQVRASTGALSTGWQHVAITRSGTAVSIYLNGALVGFRPNVAQSPADLGNTANNWLGQSEFATDAHLKGAFDEFQIFDLALSEGEIAALAGVTPATPPAATPLFGYKFDESTGTTVSDYTGHGKDGTVSGHTSWVTGFFNNAISLDNGDPNNDGQVNIPDGVLSALHDYSITIWTKPTRALDWAQLIDFGTAPASGDPQQYLALIPRAGNDGNTVRFTIKNGGGEQIVNGTSQLQVGVWSHVAITSTGDSVYLYVNGDLVGMSAAITLDPADLGNTTANTLGKSQWPDHRYDGAIDQFDVYDGVLTPEQVKDLASATPIP
jgi:hypothetical protein